MPSNDLEYAHDKYCDALLTLSTKNSWAGIAAQEYMLHYPGWRHPYANVRPLGHTWMQFTQGFYRQHPMKMPQLQLWRSSHGSAPTEAPWSTSWWSTASIPPLAGHIVNGCSVANGCDVTLQICSFYIASCGQMKHVLHMRVWSMSTSHLCAWDNPHAICECMYQVCFSISVFGLVSSGILSLVRVCSLTSWVLSDIMILESVLSGLLEVVPLAVRQKL
jgi:hypothetical protein